MVKIILNIDGMKCAMCEVHIENEIRKNFKIKKVKASHKNNTAIIISEDDIKTEYLKNVIDKTGYRILGIEKKEVVKKFIFYKEI